MVKQIYNLNEEDLKEFPVWEFLSEDDVDAIDEASVRSVVNDFDIPNNIFIVRSIFRLNSGRQYTGYVYSDARNDISYLQPVVLLNNKQFKFWFGMKIPPDIKIKEFYEAINYDENVFPIIWKIDIKMDKISSSGTLNGFYYFNLNDGKTIACTKK